MTTIMDMPKLPSKRSRLSNYDNEGSSHNNFKKRYSSPIRPEEDLDIPTSKYDFMSESERSEEIKCCQKGIYQFKLFSEKECEKLENMIDDVVLRAKNNEYKKYTVDSTPLRTKYFFGEGYTYGGQLIKPGPNQERLYAKGDVDDIPAWIQDLVINPLLKSKLLDSLLPKDKEQFFNSVVINDYAKGGCIAPHIDPIHIFCRPIITISLSSDSYLSFGCRFVYRPMRSSKPLIKLPVKRGIITSINGYAADNITHCVCPEDVTSRRTVIILRRVCDNAPRLPPYQEENDNSKNNQSNTINKNNDLNGNDGSLNRHERRAKKEIDKLKKKSHVKEHFIQKNQLNKYISEDRKKRDDNSTYKHKHSKKSIKRNCNKSRSNSISAFKEKAHSLDSNNNDSVGVKKGHSSLSYLKDNWCNRSAFKHRSSRYSSEESVKSISRGNNKLNKRHRSSKSTSDDEEKTTVVKRKNKKFRVNVKSNFDK